MKLKRSILLVGLMLMMSGCSVDNGTNENIDTNEQNKVEENVVEENEQNEEEQEKTNEDKQEKTNEDKQEVDDTKEELEENQDQEQEENQNQDENQNTDDEKDLDEEVSNNEEVEFKIYTRDVEDTEKLVEFKTINLQEESSIEEKINELILVLENDYFTDSKINIELNSIDNGIAKINLVDKDSWHQYFQGSTGGLLSQTAIVDTLLQRGYEGEWIKGVDISIDGSKEDVFDHAPFVDIFYR